MTSNLQSSLLKTSLQDSSSLSQKLRNIAEVIDDLEIPKIKEIKRKLAEKYDPQDILIEALKISRNDPLFFVKFVLEHPIFPYQAEFLKAIPKHKRIVINAGRQVGKSTVTALAILWWLIARPQSIRKVAGVEVREPALYLSVAPSYQQAQIIFGKVINILDERPAIKELFIKQIKRASSREEIITYFGSRYLSRSVSGKSGPDILRGFTASGVVIDESAFVPNLKTVLNDIIEPMVSTTNGWIILISSPNTSTDYFYQIFSGKVPGWKAFRWTTDMNPLAKEFFKQKLQELGPDHPVFQREYLAIPADTAMMVISHSSIMKAIRPRMAVSYDVYGLGLDFGISNDRSVLAVVGYSESLKIAEVVELTVFPPGTSWDTVVSTAVETANRIRRLGPAFGMMDATVFGKQIADIYPQLELAGFQPFKITPQTRMELIAMLKAVVESGKLTIPPEHKILADEMAQLTFVKRGQSIRIDHPAGAHDDAVMAVALALRALVSFGYSAVGDKDVERAKSELNYMVAKAKEEASGLNTSG